MAYSELNPPALVTEVIVSTGRAARTFAYYSTDTIEQITTAGYFANGFDLGMREGDTVIFKDLTIGLWHQIDLIVQDVGADDVITVAVPEIVEAAVPDGDALDEGDDYFAMFQNGRMTRVEVSAVFAGALDEAVLKAQNLNDLADKAQARENVLLPTYVTTLTALASLDTTKDIVAHVISSDSVWFWRTGNYAARVTADVDGALFKKADAIATTVGAWVRSGVTDFIDVRWGGIAGNGTTDDRTKLFNLNALAVILGYALYFPPGVTCLVNSALTLSATVRMRGGRLKPANGISITISGLFNCQDRVRCFDLSLGGLIIGSGYLPHHMVFPEWWGADPTNPGVNSTAFIQAAIDYLEQRSVSGGAAKGGIVSFAQGWYGVSATLTVRERDIQLKGVGAWATYFHLTVSTRTIEVIGESNGTGAAYGFRCEGIQFYHTDLFPASGADIYIERVLECKIRDNHFTNPYQAIFAKNCQGSLVKEITGNNITQAPVEDWATATAYTVGGYTVFDNATYQAVDSHTSGATFAGDAAHWTQISTTRALSGSGMIFLTPDLAPPSGTGLCERFYMSHNTATTVRLDYGLFISGADTLHCHNNHFAGNQQAPLFIQPTKNTYNMHFTGNCWEGLHGGAKHYANRACYINCSDPDVLMNNFLFVNEQFLGGVVNMFEVAGTQPFGISVTNCEFTQAINNTILLSGGGDITFSECMLHGIDLSITGSRTFVSVGNGVTGPNGCQLNGLKMEQVPAFLGTTHSGAVTITNASPGVVTWNAHGFSVDMPVVFSTTGALPTGLTAGVTYYIKSVTANTFTVAASPGGLAINTSSAGSGTHTADVIKWQVPQYGIRLRNGMQVQVSNCKINSAVTSISMEMAADEVQVSNCRVSQPNSIASATTILPPVGHDIAVVTGAVQIENLDDVITGGHAAFRRRRVLLRFASTPTVKHATGNIRLNGGVDFVASADDYLELQYHAESGVWVETGRMVA